MKDAGTCLKQGSPDEYADTPVRQGTLTEIKDSKWLNHSVTNKQGEKVAKVTNVLRDEKTQKIEYVIIEIRRLAARSSGVMEPLRGARRQTDTERDQGRADASFGQKDSKDMSPDLPVF
jgi:hypothetical protein